MLVIVMPPRRLNLSIVPSMESKTTHPWGIGKRWKETWVLIAFREAYNYPHTLSSELGPGSFINERILR